MASLEVLLGVAAAVVLLGVLAVRVSVRLGLPSLLLYLGIGILLGESVLGIRFSDAGMTEAAGLGALVLILAEGGITTRWATVRPALRVGIALSTVSVVVSIAVVGTALHVALGLDWRTAFLWGAVLSSTDAAAVFSVLRGVGVSRRLRGALELESGMNDAPVVLAVVLLASDDPITWLTPVLVVYELLAGAVDRVRAGPGGRLGAAARRAPVDRPVPARRARRLRARLLGRAARARLRAARDLRRRAGPRQLQPAAPGDVLSFVEGTGWLAQIGLFVLLGLYASPPRLIDAVVPALIAGVVLVVAARPLSVIAAAAPFRVPWREQAFLSWSGLRGAVPIVLALVALQEGAPNAQRLVDAVFVLVVVLTLLQGTTLPFVARRLGVVAVERARDRGRRRPAGRAGRRPAAGPGAGGSRLRGVYLRELRLPRGATVSLVVRDEEAFTPTVDTRLRVGDQLLVVTTAAAREATERRIRAVDRAGRLARWHGESGPLRDDGGRECRRRPRTAARSRRGTRVPLLVGIAALVLVADVVTKVPRRARLEGREPVELLGGAVYLVLVRNPGAAFSLATGYTWVLSLVAVAVVVVIARIARRLRSTGWAVALGLVLGGALGNLADRIFRSPGPLQGHVVDVVSLFAPDGSVWPVFNLADSSIVTGGVLLVLLALTGRELDGTRVARQHAAKGQAADRPGADRGHAQGRPWVTRASSPCRTGSTACGWTRGSRACWACRARRSRP